jgi:hypothetical protein
MEKPPYPSHFSGIEACYQYQHKNIPQNQKLLSGTIISPISPISPDAYHAQKGGGGFEPGSILIITSHL